jgi:hypothetical protein
MLCCAQLQATKKVATLALKIKQLKAFVHVSTAYVNCNLPRGSHIEEQIYPLYHKNGKMVEHKAIALKLADMPPAKAEAEVRFQPGCTAQQYTPFCVSGDLTTRPQPSRRCSKLCSEEDGKGRITGQCFAACMCGPLKPATMPILSEGSC